VLEEVGIKLDHGTVPELGVELLLAAWLKRARSDEASFEAWERRVVEELAAHVTW
jgi:hypothetical protein